MIISTAPTRIDLAGGTLDIWPLYLYFDNPPTLNAAIDLYATVELVPRKDKRIVVESKDLNHKAEFSSIDSLPDKHPLHLIPENAEILSSAARTYDRDLKQSAARIRYRRVLGFKHRPTGGAQCVLWKKSQ